MPLTDYKVDNDLFVLTIDGTHNCNPDLGFPCGYCDYAALEHIRRCEQCGWIEGGARGDVDYIFAKENTGGY